jgi:hypothetical protein
MIGDKEAFLHLYRGNLFKGIFLIVGDKPDWFNPDDQDFLLPSIYTEQNRPKPYDCGFFKDQKIHLIQSKTASDEFFFTWYRHMLTLKTKMLLALDSENKLYVS